SPLAARRPRGSRVRGRPPRGRGRRNRAIATRRGPRPHEGGSPILVRPRTFGGVLLCAVLLGATWPILAALPGVPSQILAGDAYVITQGSGALSINTSLAENLTRQFAAGNVSQEILCLGTHRGEPVLHGGVQPDPFFAIEGAEP